MDRLYRHALKLLSKRDYTTADLRRLLEGRFEIAPNEVIDRLIRDNFLNDRRYVENYARKRKHRGCVAVREELAAHGIEPKLLDEILSLMEWPSIREVLTAKMDRWKLRPPLQTRDAARLFSALLRLGYDEDAIREEIDKLHEQ